MIDDFDEGELFPTSKTPIQPAIQEIVRVQHGNPLASYFRIPGLTVALPSGGAFMPEGSIDFNSDGTVDVFPMRGSDELLLMSPDALMNGSAIISLLRSCVPQVKCPEELSVPDLDVLLLAIRIASTGETMDITLNCDECGHDSTFAIDVPSMVRTAQTINPTNTIRVRDDMVIWVRPNTVADQSRMMVDVFKETRNAQALDFDETLSEEDKKEGMSKIMKRIADMTTYGIARSVVKIVIPDAEVTDFNHIEQFLQNTDRKTIKMIEHKLEEIKAQGVDKNFPAVCQHCQHEWEAEVNFDPSSFFGDRSSE